MKAIIVDSRLREVDGVRHELMEWATGLGVKANKALPLFVLTQDDSGKWTAHFSIKRGPAGNPDGPDLIQPGSNRVQTDYGSFVVDLPDHSWPKWFPNAEEAPDIPVPVMLELLAVADSADIDLRHAVQRYNRLGW